MIRVAMACSVAVLGVLLSPLTSGASSGAGANELPLIDSQLTDYPPVVQGPSENDYLLHFEESGRPKFNYHVSVAKRFARHLNHGVDPSSLAPSAREKWQKIYDELKHYADRTVSTPTALLLIDLSDAEKWSHALETSGAVAPAGAWTIAVEATAVNHGFARTPCAEFQSEIVRESYRRAGYNVSDDFNSKKGNELIWSNSAAVVEFSQHLDTAGWIPWETKFYQAPIGAIMMNGAGETPGHTFIAANVGASVIVDNGSPQGLDLHRTSDRIINMEYEAGVFFLPPGINPRPWPAP